MDSMDSMCSAHGVLMDSMDSMSSTVHGVPWSAYGVYGLHVQCSWTAHRLHVDCREYSHGVLILLMESMSTAHGVHGKVWVLHCVMV